MMAGKKLKVLTRQRPLRRPPGEISLNDCWKQREKHAHIRWLKHIGIYRQSCHGYTATKFTQEQEKGAGENPPMPPTVYGQNEIKINKRSSEHMQLLSITKKT